MVIHSGDATFRGDQKEIIQFNKWYGKLPHKYKIFVAGNHDWLFQRDHNHAKSLLDPSIIYLEDSEVTINGIKIYGSPWQPAFCDWAFNVRRGPTHIGLKWAMIPENVDILITHGPPRYFGDTVIRMDDMMWPGDGMLEGRKENVGCADLLERIEKIKPRYHIFGHIHRGYGVYSSENTTFINASVVNERYENVNTPITFDI